MFGIAAHVATTMHRHDDGERTVARVRWLPHVEVHRLLLARALVGLIGAFHQCATVRHIPGDVERVVRLAIDRHGGRCLHP